MRTPDTRYKAGVRRFPQLVPEHENDPDAAISRKARGSWIRNCPEPLVLPSGGHFLQEWGEEVATWFLSQT
jgi:haloalkane dehalogenase